MAKYPKTILTFIAYLKKLPGIGTKTAERFAFEIIKWKSSELSSFGNLILTMRETLKHCGECGCLKEESSCPFCDDKSRNRDLLCIIASPKDAYLVENTNSFQGLYHVIENLISPIDGFHLDSLSLEKIEKRIHENKVKEIIIALDSTLEGDATSLFLKNKLKNKKDDLLISRLAFGLPVGSSLEYIDGGTLAKAFVGRQNF
jgi:recombination protein RecR